MSQPPPRLKSLDALRGFDMFWIIGGGALFRALAEATNWPLLRWMEHHLEHALWHGFTFYDLIFPLFLFIAGVSMPFSLGKRLERGDDLGTLRMHVVRRGLLLVFLGVVYNGLFKFDFETLRYASVLGRIGLAYLFAGLIFLSSGVRGQIVWIAGVLLGYWAALILVPVPEFGAGDLAPGHTFTDWVDRQLLPGRLHRTVRDPEGLCSTIPAIATALLGALAGHWLKDGSRTGSKKSAGLVVAGLACLALGALWDLAFPINKNLWTSSFVLWTAGCSALLLAVFHQVIDVWGVSRWAFPFIVIGLNPITIYMLQAFVDFEGIAQGVFANAANRVHPALMVGSGLLLRWLVLFWMYRRRLFLRV